ncbi:hypothetical protein [Tsukamurella sp. 1534]|uniref:hypothetical protein n=1 Tax=Tsukamurella sp. 1534 TaxID=1151061 RepID=UPI0003059A2A|nr:hypothetical protein [Tsukamurella sp. 1534]
MSTSIANTASREAHELTSAYVDRLRYAREQERIAAGHAPYRYTPPEVTHPAVAEGCTDPECGRRALRDGWCSRHLAAMAGGAR